MGFSTVAAFMIILVFSLVMFGSIYSVISEVSKIYASELKEKKERLESTMNTALEIVDLYSTSNGVSHNLTVIVENIGSVTLHIEKFDILIDGVLYDFEYNRSTLYPGTSVELVVYNIPGGSGTYRMKLVTENGYSVYKTYEVV